MIKWFVYIVLLLILMPWLSTAHIRVANNRYSFKDHTTRLHIPEIVLTDTVPAKKTKQQEIDEKKRIKEITKAKRLPKPEKVDESGTTKVKPKRQRRPPGLERPPEIPRRNGN